MKHAGRQSGQGEKPNVACCLQQLQINQHALVKWLASNDGPEFKAFDSLVLVRQ